VFEREERERARKAGGCGRNGKSRESARDRVEGTKKKSETEND
jgi:hypothetical protein